MGRLQFADKALLICLVFLVPLGWTTWVFYTNTNSSITFSAKEKDGIAYNREIFPILNHAQQLRREATAMAASGTAPATLSGVQQKLPAAQALNDMTTVHSVLDNFQAAQTEMTRKHDAGMIDYAIAYQDWPGVYGELAHGMSTLAQSHIAVTMTIVDVVTGYCTSDNLTRVLDEVHGAADALLGAASEYLSSQAKQLQHPITFFNVVRLPTLAHDPLPGLPQHRAATTSSLTDTLR
ncbi:MAG: hypothetical protein K9K38_00865 [Rhodoferax sp.]|nr:hypothetical protein [Rhodoferax sp.]